MVHGQRDKDIDQALLVQRFHRVGWFFGPVDVFVGSLPVFFGPDLGPVEDRWGADCMEGGLDWKQLSSWS